MKEMKMTLITAEKAMAFGAKEELVLLEQNPHHYPAFHTFLTKEMDDAGGDVFFRGPSGMVYRLGKVLDDPGGIQGMAIHLLRVEETGAPPEQKDIDRDIWAFLEWLVDGVGGEWSIAALRKTGAIYKAPGAPMRV
jgi:hypothetical protein